MALVGLIFLGLYPRPADAADCINGTTIGGDTGSAQSCNESTTNGNGSGTPPRTRKPSYPFLNQYCGSNTFRPILNDPPASYRVIAVGPIRFAGPSGIVGFVYYDARPDKGASGDNTGYVQATVECYDSNGVLRETVNVVVPAGQVQVDPLVLRDLARARIVITDPVLAANPPLDQPGRYGIVHVPTWLWLEPAYWAPITESEAQGTVAVSVTATPQQALWSTGDGHNETCGGPGTPWRSGLADTATGCKHTYTSSSAEEPGTAYALSAAVAWQFTWTLNGVPQGPFGVVTVTSPTINYQVGEIQAIETNG
jgi:hypothetical protein